MPITYARNPAFPPATVIYHVGGNVTQTHAGRTPLPCALKIRHRQRNRQCRWVHRDRPDPTERGVQRIVNQACGKRQSTTAVTAHALRQSHVGQ